jgi:hypothetical protein
VTGPPHDGGRPRQEAPSNVVNTDSFLSIPPAGTREADPHCCQSLSLDERALLGRLRLTCSETRCARQFLLEKRADTALLCAQLRARAETYTKVASVDEHAAWLRVQPLDHADLLEVAQREAWWHERRS